MTKGQKSYDRQAKHKPIERYEAPKTTKKSKKATAVAAAYDCQYANVLQETPPIMSPINENPLKKLKVIDKLLTIRQDQETKQVINTIRDTPPEMYTPIHLAIPTQDKLSVFRKHIPIQ